MKKLVLFSILFVSITSQVYANYCDDLELVLNNNTNEQIKVVWVRANEPNKENITVVGSGEQGVTIGKAINDASHRDVWITFKLYNSQGFRLTTGGATKDYCGGDYDGGINIKYEPIDPQTYTFNGKPSDNYCSGRNCVGVLPGQAILTIGNS